MAIIRANEIREMDESKVDNKLEEIRKELMNLRAQKSSGSTPENVGRIRALKRAIARILTIKNEGGRFRRK